MSLDDIALDPLPTVPRLHRVLPPMHHDLAVQTLTDFQRWRRGAEIPIASPSEIGEALDFILEEVQQIRGGKWYGEQACVSADTINPLVGRTDNPEQDHA